METGECGACLQRITGGMQRPGGLVITERALNLCDLAPGSRVLDAGCGSGVTLHHLRGRKVKACGLDLSMEVLAEARAKDSDSQLVQATMEALPLRSGVFRGVLCECVLSHTNSEAVVREFSRILEKGGFLILSDLYRLKGEFSAPPGMEILDKGRIEGCLARCGFCIASWEDRTADLKRLAAELIMSGCALPPYYRASGPACEMGNFALRGVGYYLLVARRNDGD
jgi:SAM-dependent methyltransferase